MLLSLRKSCVLPELPNMPNLIMKALPARVQGNLNPGGISYEHGSSHPLEDLPAPQNARSSESLWRCDRNVSYENYRRRVRTTEVNASQHPQTRRNDARKDSMQWIKLPQFVQSKHTGTNRLGIAE